MAIEPDRPESVGRVLDIAFQMYKAAVWRVVPLGLVSAVIDLPLTLYWIRLTSSIETAGNDPRELLRVLSQMAGDPGYWAITLLSIILKLWVLSGLMLQVNAIAIDRQLNLGGALRQAARPAASIVVATLLYGIAIFLAFVVGAFIFALAAASGSAFVAFLFGLVASVPVILFSISLSFAGPMVLFAAKGPFSALIASHSLVMGAWWRTSIIMTVGAIVLFVIYLTAVSLIVGLYALFPDVPLLETTSTLGIGLILSLLLTPLAIALLLATFRELQLRKQGGDLLGRVATLT